MLVEKRWWTRQSALVTSGIGQLEVELLNLRGQHQALVDDGAAGERGDVEVVLALDLRGGNLVFSAAADAIEQALEGVFVQPSGRGHKQLLDVRLRGARFAADGVAVHRRIAPAEDGQAFFLGDALEDAFALQAAVLVHGQKTHGHAISARLGQLHAQLAALARKKDVGNLNQDARAVARLRIAARRAAMGEVDEDLKALADDVVAFFAANAGDQAHAAGVVLIAWMIETLRVRDAATMIRCIAWHLLDETFVQRAVSCSTGIHKAIGDSHVRIAKVNTEEVCRFRPHCRGA